MARRAHLTAQRLLADSREGDEARPAFEHALLAVAIAYQLDWSFYGLRPWADLLEEVLRTLQKARKALGCAVQLGSLLDSLFDLLLELSIESEEARENGEDPEGLAHRMGLEGLILRVEQALEVAVESVTR